MTMADVAGAKLTMNIAPNRQQSYKNKKDLGG
jgi:hypothetical protein